MILIMSLILELLECFSVWLRKGEKQKNIKTKDKTGKKNREAEKQKSEVGKETKTNAKATRRHKIGRKKHTELKKKINHNLSK